MVEEKRGGDETKAFTTTAVGLLYTSTEGVTWIVTLRLDSKMKNALSALCVKGR